VKANALLPQALQHLRVVQRVVLAGFEVEKKKKIVRLPESVNVLSLSVDEAEGGDLVDV
jgi:hypothetical protein